MPRLNRHQGGFLAAAALLLAAAFAGVRLQTDITAFVIAGDSAEEILLASEIQSGLLSRQILLSISAPEGETVSKIFLTGVLDAFKTLPGVADVRRADDSRHELAKTVETLYAPYGGYWYSLTPERDLQSLLRPQGLDERAALLKRALLSPFGDTVKKIVVHDPLLLLLNAFEGYAAANTPETPESRPYQNLVLTTEMSGLDAPAQTRIQQAVREAFARAVDVGGGKASSYRLEMTGVPIFASATQRLVENDVALISTLSAAALAALFYWLFRSFAVFFWVSCLLAATFALTLLIVNWIFGAIHGMTLAIGSTLVGVCVDYPIHALIHAQALPTEKRLAAVRQLWPSMALGAATTSVGYVALGLSGYPGFRQVAVYAGSGIAISLLLTRYLLPYLIAGVAMPSRRLRLPVFWIRLCARFRPVFLLLLAAALGAGVWQLTALRWLQDLEQLTPELNDLKTVDRKIRERMAPVEPGRFILVGGSDDEHALQTAERIYPLLDRLKAAGGLAGYYGLYPWLLSQKQQLHNARLLKTALTDDVAKNWRRALSRQELSTARLGVLPYGTDAPLAAGEVLRSSAGRALGQQIIHASAKTVLLIWLGEHRPEAVRDALGGLPDVHYFSQRDLLNQLAGVYQKRAQKLALLGFAGILLLLTARYRSPLKALVTVLPAVAATVMVLAGCSAAGEPISFLHIVGLLLVISICDDFAIFFRDNPGGDPALTYQSMAAAMLTSVLGFGCLFSAKAALLKTLATVVTGGVLLGFLLCPILIKPADRPHDRH